MKTTKALAVALLAGAALFGAAGSASAAPAGDPMAGIALKATDASMAKAGPVAAGGGSDTKGLLVGPSF